MNDIQTYRYPAHFDQESSLELLAHVGKKIVAFDTTCLRLQDDGPNLSLNITFSWNRKNLPQIFL
jgi:hypothetical protein